MEREVSQVTQLGVTLIAVAALISIVWFTVFLGNGIKGDAYNEADKIISSSSNSQLKSIEYQEDVIMPAAAAYNLICKESQYIVKLTFYDENQEETRVVPNNNGWKTEGKFSGKTFPFIQDFLTNASGSERDRMTGKVEIYSEPGADGTFEVVISVIEEK